MTDESHARAALDLAVAQRDALHDALSSLVAHVRRIGGFMEHKDQVALWRAMAVLEETRK